MRFGNFLSATSHMVLTQGFSPIKLSNLTAWYDPSDLTTLFQDSAGTTPVTSPGQPVGLVLDKSRGLVLGTELVTNGGFDSATGWTAVDGSTPLNVVAGEAVVVSTGYAQQSGRVFPVGWYEITARIRSSGQVQFKASFATGSFLAGEQVLYTGPASNYAATTVLTVQVNNPTAAKSVLVIKEARGTGGTLYIDNISVREIPGNHLIQATAAKRPEYGIMPKGGVRNLLTYTEDFSNSVWNIAATVTPNATTAPDGTNTADLMVVASTGNDRKVQGGVVVPSGVTSLTLSVYAKAYNANNGFKVLIYNSTTAAVVSTRVHLHASDGVDAGNSWKRFSLTVSTGFSVGDSVAAYIYADDTNAIGEGNYFWGAQLETGSTPTAYQKVVSAREVTEAGQPSLHYLYFDGIDDALATAGNVDLTTTDSVSVFAGVRKESDAAQGNLLEISADLGANNGAFRITAPDSAAANYNFRSKGTSIGSVTVSGVAAPVSNVLTALGKISSDTATLRINGGSVSGTGVNDQGTGNFGSYPLYIGARAGTSIYFKGNLYNLILRSVLSSDSAISQVERWLAQKTGVTI